MANMIYNSFKEYMADGSIDLDNDAFKVMLLTKSYTANASHTKIASVSGNEISGTGYTAGGGTLDSVTWTRSGTKVTFDAADEAWTSATFTAAYAAVYDDTHASDLLVCLFDFSGSQSVTNGTFTLQWGSSGIFTLE